MSVIARVAVVLAATASLLAFAGSASAGVIVQTSGAVKVFNNGSINPDPCALPPSACSTVVATGGFTPDSARYHTVTGQVTIDHWSLQSYADRIGCYVVLYSADGVKSTTYMQVNRTRGTYTMRWSERVYLRRVGYLVVVRCTTTATYATMFARNGAVSWT